jgi:ATP-binding protein involved in chromosome partitioning
MSDALDPRPFAIADRLSGVDRVIAVTGSKGGIGTSVVASTLALALADSGERVGLFDLDFTSPSDHVVLGVERSFPEEQFGIDPHEVHGLRMMSVAFFAGDSAVPLRGAATTNALLELLAITRWGDLDILILDMPPGLGDTSLDVINLLPRIEFLLLGNSSKVVVESVHKALALLSELGVPLIGLLENMQRVDDGAVASLAAEFGVPLLGPVPFDAGLEWAIGDADRLRQTRVYRELDRLLAESALAPR